MDGHHGRSEAAGASPKAVEAELPLGQDGEMWMAIMAAQKVAEASPTVVEAGLLLRKDGEMWMAIMAAQEAAGAVPTTAEEGAPSVQMK